MVFAKVLILLRFSNIIKCKLLTSNAFIAFDDYQVNLDSILRKGEKG